MNTSSAAGAWVELVLELALAGVAAIHLLPVVGVVSVERLERIYGVSIAGPDLAVLLRHRALMFGLLGGLVTIAILDSTLRWPMVIATLFSDLGFAALTWSQAGTSTAMGRVLRADLLSIGLLVVAGVLLAIKPQLG